MSEREFEGHETLIAELRAGTLDAPGHLRRRVVADAPAKRHRWRAMSARRRMFMVVPVAASLAVGAALVHGAFFAGSSAQKSAAPTVLSPSNRPPRHVPASGATGL